MVSTLLCLIVALPDATVSRPERLLAPTEIALDVGPAGFLSHTTKTPLGAIERDAFAETTMRARVQVGVLKFLTTSLTVPMGDLVLWEQRHLGQLRFGDPTFGIGIGPAFKNVHLAAFGELTIATINKTVLRPREPTLLPSTHGAVISTGGVSFVTGAFVYFQHDRERLSFRMSARAAYRLRSNDASNGVLGDVRLELVLLDHLLLGFNASTLVPMGGLEQALMSPSRSADSSGYVDVGARLGYRFVRTIDLSASFSAPVYTVAGGLGLAFGLLASFFFGPY